VSSAPALLLLAQCFERFLLALQCGLAQISGVHLRILLAHLVPPSRPAREPPARIAEQKGDHIDQALPPRRN
jgi:hypothetical protein